jgi:molybdopterin-guanine dinucleotide biosynthesis protein B
MNMRAISIVGPKKSGKTTLGLQLIHQLRQQGLSVAVAKSSHHGFDGQDTDTEQYAQTGCAVLGMGPDESFVRWPEKRDLTSLLPLVDADLLLVEGCKKLQWLPRILVLDTIPDEGLDWLSPELAIAVFGKASIPGVPTISSIRELADLIQKKAFMLPGLDCGSCGRPDCGELAREIVAGQADPEDCAALDSPVHVEINGRQLGMNTFMGRLVASTIRGLLREFKGFTNGEAVIKLDV